MTDVGENRHVIRAGVVGFVIESSNNEVMEHILVELIKD